MNGCSIKESTASWCTSILISQHPHSTLNVFSILDAISYDRGSRFFTPCLKFAVGHIFAPTALVARYLGLIHMCHRLHRCSVHPHAGITNYVYWDSCMDTGPNLIVMQVWVNVPEHRLSPFRDTHLQCCTGSP